MLIIQSYTLYTHHHYTGRNMPYIDPSFIYVIVDLAKNNMRKTEYKITNHITGAYCVYINACLECCVQ